MSQIEFDKISSIVLDYDRTVTDMSLKFDERVMAPIMALRREGIRVALVTGREWSSLERLKNLFDAIAYENGAIIYANARKYRYFRQKNSRIRKLLIENRIQYTEGEVILSISTADFDTYRQMFDNIENAEYIRNIDSVMILPRGINKGTAVLNIQKIFGLKENYCLAIGDGENDIEMFKQARYRACLGNSVPELKKISDICTEMQASEGVLELLQSIINMRGKR